PLFYLASPALPIGAFAWSQGMEGAIAEGRLRNRAEVTAWLAGILAYGLGRFDIPLFSRCFKAALNRDAAGLDGWNALALAGRETAELREEEGRLGEALCRILRDQNLMPAWVKTKRGLGYVAAFALAAVRLGEGAGSFAGEAGEALFHAAGAFVWSWLENQVAAAAKAIPLGQTDGGRVLLELMPQVPEVVRQGLELPDSDIGASLPGLALVSMRHERQYSRLFRS
ncbi:MAG: urease accessory protein UreF, partial [Planctomycetota bacterium]|nr:urease accessory protein UreF [Planctomycetota bacterium]